MDPKLLDILVCPLCKSPLRYDKSEQRLVCVAEKIYFPIQDGIPVMLPEAAQPLTDAERT